MRAKEQFLQWRDRNGASLRRSTPLPRGLRRESRAHALVRLIGALVVLDIEERPKHGPTPTHDDRAFLRVAVGDAEFRDTVADIVKRAALAITALAAVVDAALVANLEQLPVNVLLLVVFQHAVDADDSERRPQVAPKSEAGVLRLAHGARHQVKRQRLAHFSPQGVRSVPFHIVIRPSELVLQVRGFALAAGAAPLRDATIDERPPIVNVLTNRHVLVNGAISPRAA
mmetsp:Transcript_99629/g.286191  ORF Transcript_99629/g.286191 Transcript_99629/m.286191 type:complete len:228 (-) Transcript_99629:208-891(-)